MFAKAIFCVSLATALAYIALTCGQLPENPASHFIIGGRANAYMSREAYRSFMLGLTLLAPLLLVAAIVLLPRLVPVRFFNLPNRDYWLAPARREATLRRITWSGWWLGSLLALFLAAAHAFVVDANLHSPPQLAERPFLAMLGGFLALFLGLSVGSGLCMMRHFSKPPANWEGR